MISIAIVSVLIIIVLFALSKLPNRKPSRKPKCKAEAKADKSSGLFDIEAATALAIAENEHTAQSEFVAGRIIQHNILENDPTRDQQAAQEAANHYANAIALMFAEADDAPDNAMFIIDEFDAVAAPPIEFTLPIEFTPPIELAPARAEVSRRRQATAAATAKTHADFTQKYLAASVETVSDAQNVHDTAVVDAATETVRALRSTALRRGPVETMAEVRQKIAQMPSRRAEATKTLDSLTDACMVSSINTSLPALLELVWDRSLCPANKDNRDNIQEAIVNALADSVEHGHVVCVSGRSQRLIGALATLDYEDSVGALNTHNALKNEIYTECSKLVDRVVKAERRNKDKEIADAAKSYEDPAVVATEAGEVKLTELIHVEIDQLTAEYADRLRSDQLAAIKENCYAAV